MTLRPHRPWAPAHHPDAPMARQTLDAPVISNLTNSLKTWTLLAALGALLVAVGGLLGGRSGLVVALLFAVAMNAFVYWKSDSLALRANGARELKPDELPRVRAIVADLAQRAGLPMPRLYLVDRPEPNAFATGRDPNHAAVAVTTGILDVMDERELRGVLAHELSHVKNRDTLVGTIAATIGGAISFLAQMAQFQMIFGGGRDEEGGGGGFGGLIAIILAPIAALIIQLAVSRGREYGADRSGAQLTGDPEGLAQALLQLDAAAKRQPGLLGRMAQRMPGRGGQSPAPAPAPAANPAFAHLYIVNPLSGRAVGGLFSTHPPIEERVARLRSMEGRLAAGPSPSDSASRPWRVAIETFRGRSVSMKQRHPSSAPGDRPLDSHHRAPPRPSGVGRRRRPRGAPQRLARPGRRGYVPDDPDRVDAQPERRDGRRRNAGDVDEHRRRSPSRPLPKRPGRVRLRQHRTGRHVVDHAVGSRDLSVPR
jgi:heat shock protein HtpX